MSYKSFSQIIGINPDFIPVKTIEVVRQIKNGFIRILDLLNKLSPKFPSHRLYQIVIRDLIRRFDRIITMLKTNLLANKLTKWEEEKLQEKTENQRLIVKELMENNKLSFVFDILEKNDDLLHETCLFDIIDREYINNLSIVCDLPVSLIMREITLDLISNSDLIFIEDLICLIDSTDLYIMGYDHISFYSQTKTFLLKLANLVQYFRRIPSKGFVDKIWGFIGWTKQKKTIEISIPEIKIEKEERRFKEIVSPPIVGHAIVGTKPCYSTKIKRLVSKVERKRKKKIERVKVPIPEGKQTEYNNLDGARKANACPFLIRSPVLVEECVEHVKNQTDLDSDEINKKVADESGTNSKIDFDME